MRKSFPLSIRLSLLFAPLLCLACGREPRAVPPLARAVPEAPATAARPPLGQEPAPSPTRADAAIPRTCAHPTAGEGKSATSRDGRISVFVGSDPSRTIATSVGDVPYEDVCVVVDGQPARVLVAGRSLGPDEGVERTLAGFGDLLVSQDGATVFFTSIAWATSSAAHAVDVPSGKHAFLFDGAVVTEVSAGPDTGRFVASHFRLDDAHPVTSPDYRGRMETWSLVERDGKTVRKLGAAEAARLGRR